MHEPTTMLEALVAMVLAAAVLVPVASADDLITCESTNGSRVFCSADTRGGVTLVRQLGDRDCTGNWGWNESGVWVDNGCRAELRLGEEAEQSAEQPPDLLGNLFSLMAGDADERTITCESQDNRRAYCRADTSGGVRLTSQLSRATCTGNWGYDSGGVWVDEGCRGVFELLTPAPAPTPTPEPTPTPRPDTLRSDSVTCSSRGDARTYCMADTSRGVTLVSRLSSEPCVGSWGYDSDGIWVEDGCRAEFRVGPAGQPVGEELTVIVCESQNSRRAFCSADTSGGARLHRQLSNTSCDGRWGFEPGGIWVDDGCRAEFELGRSRQPATDEVASAPAGARVVCRSTGASRVYCSAAVTTAVRLVRRLSDDVCTGNWGVDEYGVWVRNGCQAEFEYE